MASPTSSSSSLSRNMRSPSIIHQPFPISQITPSTIVLGSSFYSNNSEDDSAAANTNRAPEPMVVESTSSPLGSPTTAQPSIFDYGGKNPIVASLEQSVQHSNNAYDNDTDDDDNDTKSYEQEDDGGGGSGSGSGAETIAIPFSNRQIEASSVLVTSNEPPERCTSPRRDNSAIERIGREKVHVLRKEAQLMQDSLTDILDRIVQVRDEYDRLSGENRFLQDYIGNLMATSKILNKT